MTIYPVGTVVNIHKSDFGTITAICIRGKGLVTYEISFWDKADYRIIWVQADDIKIKNSLETIQIGFLSVE